MDKEIVQTNNSLSLKNQQVLAAKILGATLNCDISSLYKLLKDNEKNDEVSFVILTGIFKLLSQKKEDYERVLYPIDSTKNGRPGPQKLLKYFFEKFEKILAKQEYGDYPVAAIPSTDLNKKYFLGECFLGIFGQLFEDLFFGNFSRHQGDDAFIVSDNVKSLFRIVSNPELVDDDFNGLLLTTVYDSLDAVYITTFSNSKSKVWDARRASLEYFIKQLYIFNDKILKKNQEALFRRWKAWFILEDFYKIKNKKVDRKKLQAEMLEIFK